MSKSHFEISPVGAETVVKISGVIDEDTDFSKVDIRAAASLRLDLSGIKSINSCGIRDWIKWLSSSAAQAVVFHDCPKVIVDQINMVQGFLPANGRVTSFYVPYFCEETDEEKQVLFRLGTEYAEDGGISAPEVLDSSGNGMEMDIVESKYFKFLQKK
jgi:hypothetical protein